MHQKLRDRQDPRLSLATMAEYCRATPRRREAILLEARRPRDYIVAQYREATSAVARALTVDGDWAAALHREARRLEGRPLGAGSTAPRDRANAVEALEHCARHIGNLSEPGLRAERLDVRALSLRVEGVLISVQPQVLLFAPDRRGQLRVGALVTLFRKSRQLPEGALEIAADMLTRTLLKHPSVEARGKVDGRLCHILEPFHGNHVRGKRQPAPSIGKDVSASCREVAKLWPMLYERDVA